MSLNGHFFTYSTLCRIDIYDSRNIIYNIREKETISLLLNVYIGIKISVGDSYD